MVGGWGLAILAIAIGLAGCAGSTVVKQHALFPAIGDTHYARVYLLRPQAQRARGVSDNVIGVEAGRQKLVDLAQGEYILVHLKPGETDIVSRNLTELTTKEMPQEVWRARHFNFDAGRDYFIEFEQDYEEFRGIYYIPKQIDATRARTLAERLRAGDELAEKHPLSALR